MYNELVHYCNFYPTEAIHQSEKLVVYATVNGTVEVKTKLTQYTVITE